MHFVELAAGHKPVHLHAGCSIVKCQNLADQLPWCINTGKSLIPLTLLFLAQKRNLLIPLELSGVMHQGTFVAVSMYARWLRPHPRPVPKLGLFEIDHKSAA